MKIKSIIAKVLLIMSLFAVLPLIFSQDNYAYASREELLDLEEKSPISRMKQRKDRLTVKATTIWKSGVMMYRMK